MNNYISTIIPFFNNEASLGRMLDSILKGSIIPDEIILINDGSTDRSAIIAQEYVSNHKNIHLFSMPHSGVSAARNLGLEKSSGKWISFLDADDYIDENMYEIMLNSVKDRDVSGCICGYYTVTDGITTAYSADAPSIISASDLLKAMFTDDNVRGFLFTRLFRSELLKGKVFDTDINICEDLLFQTQLYKDSSVNFALINKPLYYYSQETASLTNSLNYFDNDIFKYKPAFSKIYKIIPQDYVLTDYNSILEYSMYTLLKAYKIGSKDLLSQIRILQKILKSTPCLKKSKRRLAYMYMPILFSYFLND